MSSETGRQSGAHTRLQHSCCRPLAGSLPAWLVVTTLTACAGIASAQTPPSPQILAMQTPRWWADAGGANEEKIVNDTGIAPLRYRVRKVDAKGDTTREVMESREGTVARLVQRNGAPLTPEEDAAERDRLNEILSSPEAFLRHHRRDKAALSYATELIHAMPEAMLWSYAPGQPQVQAASGPQIVLDFLPDPHYKPRSLVTEGLTGIAGRIWIDERTRCVVRIQGSILHPVDFGWGGMLARINEGGTVAFEQMPAGPQRWLFSQLEEHISIREVMVRTVKENTRMNAWDVQPLPAQISFQDAVHELLAMPVPTR